MNKLYNFMIWLSYLPFKEEDTSKKPALWHVNTAGHWLGQGIIRPVSRWDCMKCECRINLGRFVNVATCTSALCNTSLNRFCRGTIKHGLAFAICLPLWDWSLQFKGWLYSTRAVYAYTEEYISLLLLAMN